MIRHCAGSHLYVDDLARCSALSAGFVDGLKDRVIGETVNRLCPGIGSGGAAPMLSLPHDAVCSLPVIRKAKQKPKNERWRASSW